MSNYIRVIPRDLFNEANLLKCYGRIYINAESAAWDSPARHIAIEGNEDGKGFDVQQDQASGGITVANITVSLQGARLGLVRPLNSRDAWPLWLETINGEEIDDPVEVFTDEGAFSDEFLGHCAALIKGR